MGGSLFFKDLIVYSALIIFVLFYTKKHNLWGVKKGTSKTKVDVRKLKDDTKKRNFLLKVLNYCESVCFNFGFKPLESKIETFTFKIDRVGIKIPYVDRNIRATELMGAFKILKFVFSFLGLLFYFITFNPMYLLLLVVLAIDTVFNLVMDSKIMEEDKEIEQDFPDLFLLLYSRLARGTDTRISPTLDEYIKSIDAIYGEVSHNAIRKFVLELRKNIEIYGDDSMAVNEMRKTYKCAMLVNFFNLAIQSLRGVDNRDKLLAFKMELSQQKLEQMTKKANELVEKGKKAIMLIFVILAQFVVLSWVAKAGLSFMYF